MPFLRLFVAFSLTACDAITGPSYFDGATPIVADTSFARVWREVEDCSGLRGDFASVRWFRSENLGPGVGGAVNHGERKAVLLGSELDNWCAHGDSPALRGCLFTEKIIGHEALHLLAGRSSDSHPKPLFSKTGPCRDVIRTMD